MAGWKKHFKIRTDGMYSPIPGNVDTMNVDGSRGSGGSASYSNYGSRLPDVYTGHPNRIERYNQFESMDMDSEVNACLDIISEFSTQNNTQNQTPFNITFKEKPTDNEVEIIKTQLQQWCKLNEMDKRAFKLFRNTIKYGDQVFVRDPETFELYWVDMTKVKRVIVNESEGKKPEQYIISDINPNFENLTVAAKTTGQATVAPPSYGGGYPQPGTYTAPNSEMGGGSRFQQNMNEHCIDAAHICHVSLSEGLDYHWPFGQSILENVYKVFKQKELLEDALLIYRVQRAPERRVFKIDVGNMPSHMAMAFVERIKNEVHQRRIPTREGGSTNMVDATYNPLSMNEDYFFPTTADGRGSSVEVLPGGQNLGEIDDLRYFNNKLARGLRVPSSYLPAGPDDSVQQLTDGRVGTALIQEYRFNQYCQRLQNRMSDKLDQEFKMFVKFRGFNIDASMFTITFNAPQNFASYRQAELDQQRVQIFGALEAIPYMSKRFLMKRFLGLEEEEMLENEQLWSEEKDKMEDAGAVSGDQLRSVGISPGDIEADMNTADDLGVDIDTEETGAEGEDTEAATDET